MTRVRDYKALYRKVPLAVPRMSPEEKKAIMAEAPTQEQWSVIFGMPATERPWFTDEEAAQIASVTERNLRSLQARGLIRAERANTGVPGGYRRMWGSEAVDLAAVAGELIRLLDWPVIKAAKVLGLVTIRRELLKSPILQPLIVDSLSLFRDTNHMLVDNKEIKHEADDWFLLVHDGRFVFLDIPKHSMKIMWAAHRPFPIGVICDEDVVPVSFYFEDDEIFERLQSRVSVEDAQLRLRELRLVRAAAMHPRTTIRINLSMPIRAASRRMKGLSVQYVADASMEFLSGIWQQSTRSEP